MVGVSSWRPPPKRKLVEIAKPLDHPTWVLEIGTNMNPMLFGVTILRQAESNHVESPFALIIICF